MFKILLLLFFSFNLDASVACNKNGQDFELRLESVIKTLKISKTKAKSIYLVLNQAKKETAKIENELKKIKKKILDELGKEDVDEGSIRFLKEELVNKYFTSVDNKILVLKKIKGILGPESFNKFQKNHRLRLQKDVKRNKICE